MTGPITRNELFHKEKVNMKLVENTMKQII